MRIVLANKFADTVFFRLVLIRIINLFVQYDP